MKAVLILSIFLIMLILASLLIRYINKQYEIDFQEWKKDYKFEDPIEKHCYNCIYYDKLHNMCEHDWFFGYVSEYTIFDCYNENGKVNIV